MGPCRKQVIAVDVGGSKIAAALVDADGAVSHRLQVTTDPAGDGRAIAQVADLAARLAREQEAKPRAVGVAVPAAIDPTRRVVDWAPNVPGWQRIALADDLEGRLGLPVLLEQDGLASVVGEHWLGAAQGARNAVMLVLGTGIGGGMILDGRLYRGSDGLAGCAAWLTCGYPWPAAASERRLGALEAVASGPAIARRAGARSERAEDVFAAALGGNEQARRILDEAIERLGFAVADIVSLLNPDVVVIGGGLGSGGSAQLIGRLRVLVNELAQPVSARRAQIVPSGLGVNAALLGVAYQVFSEL